MGGAGAGEEAAPTPTPAANRAADRAAVAAAVASMQANGAGSSGGPTSASGLHYSIPGILHFLQHEWSRFEMDRSQWEVEKAELQARIAFLQGERKGQENLKNDLVRRIKMLEYALKQERAKYHKLKYGAVEGSGGADKPAAGEEEGENPHQLADGDNYIAVSNVNWRQGRQLLRQYLNEIGYTDTIIDVRSNRVRSLLGLNDADSNNAASSSNEDNNRMLVNGGDAKEGAGTGSEKKGAEGGAKQQQQARGKTLTEEMMMETEAAVMANFDFLSSEAEVDEDDLGEDGDEGGFGLEEMKAKAGKLTQAVADATAAADDKDTEEVLNEFSFLTGDGVDGGRGGGAKSDEKGIIPDFLGGGSGRGQTASAGVSASSSPGAAAGASPSEKEKAESLELGELEQLTITNDNESSYDITTPKEAFRKTWSAKYTLRSHFDGVRALGFHPTEPVLITASEDQTLKYWNLQKTIPAKKSASLDVEPVYTFRGHEGAILSLAVSPLGDYLFSGGIDSTVRVWSMPSPNIDPYDSFDAAILAVSLTGHTDAVWGLSYHGGRQQLLSCSADGAIKLWSPITNKQNPLVKTFGSNSEFGVPTSVDWVHENSSHMVAAYKKNATCIIYEIESGKPVMKLDVTPDPACSISLGVEVGPITKVVSHPTLPLTITAHEDRHIRFWDNNTGKLTHAMVAHLDAVSSLSLDTNGLYLISGSHDCSIRLWNLETKTCVQEITAHRKKFDESIFAVAFHPSKPYIASAGADALAKVFV